MLLDRLLKLRVPQRLPEEVAADAGEILVYDLRGTLRRRVVTVAASSCFDPRDLPPEAP